MMHPTVTWKVDIEKEGREILEKGLAIDKEAIENWSYKLSIYSCYSGDDPPGNQGDKHIPLNY